MTALLDPARTVLLAMDFQTGIVGRLPEGQEIVARVGGAIAAARAAGAGIGYVRVALTDDDLDGLPPHSPFQTYAADPDARAGFAPDAASTQVVDALAPQPGDIVVRKSRVGPFTTTDLLDQLSGRSADTLVLTGLSTSGVVLSTVRQAADLDFRLVVLSDGCGDRDGTVHRVLTEQVFPRQADVVTCAELPALLVP